jgi:hypothetical protein
MPCTRIGERELPRRLIGLPLRASERRLRSLARTATERCDRRALEGLAEREPRRGRSAEVLRSTIRAVDCALRFAWASAWLRGCERERDGAVGGCSGRAAIASVETAAPRRRQQCRCLDPSGDSLLSWTKLSCGRREARKTRWLLPTDAASSPVCSSRPLGTNCERVVRPVADDRNR